jgi:hypothetical protein
MLRAITPTIVRVWWTGLGKATPTRNVHAYQLLKAIFNTAIEDKVVKENPCEVKVSQATRRQAADARRAGQGGRVGTGDQPGCGGRGGTGGLRFGS